MLCGEASRDHRAQRITDHVRALDLQVIEKAHHVAGHHLAVPGGVVRLVTLAVTSQVERDDAMIVREIRENTVSEEVPIERAGIAVHQDDRWPASLLDVSEPNAVRVEELVRRGNSRLRKDLRCRQENEAGERRAPANASRHRSNCIDL